MLRLIAGLLLCCSTLAAQSIPDFSAARGQLRSLVESGAVPGIAVAVTQHGRILWQEGFGWADREGRVLATADTPFYLASVTKSLTATAVMVLHQSGKLNLDRPINDYLAPAKIHSPMWDAREATVRRVATHTAGLTTFYRACKAGDPHCKMSLDDEIERYGILFWPPGERFDYSNLGYAVLGEAIAHASHESFPHFLKTHVFNPLGMTHCGLGQTGGAAATYDEHTHRRSPQTISGTPGASAAYGSAHDLALFAMFQLKDHLPTQRPVLSDAAIDELHRPVAHASNQQYAIGWWIEERDGEQVIFGQGGTTNSFTLLELFPAEDVGIVLLANSYSDKLRMPNRIEQAILDALRPGRRPQPSSTAPPQPPRPPAQQLIGDWAGDIQTRAGAIPVRLSLSASREAHGRVGSNMDAPLRSLALGGEHVYGILAADLHESDAPAGDIELDLFLRGNKLAGAATTRPGEASDAQLPHWTELHKLN